MSATPLTDTDGDPVLVDQSNFTLWHRVMIIRSYSKNYYVLLTGTEASLVEPTLPVRPVKLKLRSADDSYAELIEEYKLDIATYRFESDRYEKYQTRQRKCIA
ncbi:unnamed protein product [Zymoseptoria tritici ST99CH_1A5]|uniref:Uncharacterized protein n=1 Tax=Zymoseptoria tritici ST99CH_1A5 TaxID=1276529 RepID=A0A1Y6LRY6_ZYMTR|nr:unnamed protein product [Zymoseptoria tritici ST99CH_1A5]